jgi:low temperature requirement protein LtrA
MERSPQRHEGGGGTIQDPDQQGLLRGRAGSDQQVTPFELFFDLVFVFAVTQLSHRLLDHLTMGGAAQTLLLLLVVWQAWVTTTWITNWFNPDQLPVRFMLVGVMLASLFMSVAIPDAFGDRGLMFAAAVAAIHVGRAAFAFIALRGSLGGLDPLTRTFQRALSWHVAAGGFWVAGGLLDGRARYLAWGLALVMNFVAPLIGYYLPGLGAARTREWAVQGHYFAERCRLFIIIALGESLLVTGATFGGGKVSMATTAAFVVAFGSSVALWWIYFQHSAEAASQVLAAAADPGRLARSAYTYFHLPMVAGIIAVAAADELTVAHPGDHGTPASVALTLGGTMLFVAGHALFKRAMFKALGDHGRLPGSDGAGVQLSERDVPERRQDALLDLLAGAVLGAWVLVLPGRPPLGHHVLAEQGPSLGRIRLCRAGSWSRPVRSSARCSASARRMVGKMPAERWWVPSW